MWISFVLFYWFLAFSRALERTDSEAGDRLQSVLLAFSFLENLEIQVS